jgi:hypothetical protein
VRLTMHNDRRIRRRSDDELHTHQIIGRRKVWLLKRVSLIALVTIVLIVFWSVIWTSGRSVAPNASPLLQGVTAPSPVPLAVPSIYTGVYHRGGSEHIQTAAEVVSAVSQGMTLSMNYGPVTGTLATQMTISGMKYLDRRIADFIYNACNFPAPRRTCSLSTAQESAVMDQVNRYLSENGNDPLIAGYYIIDDFPGNVSHLLELITTAVHAATPTKPTVCAFASSLDFWFTDDHTGRPATAHAALDQAIVNYTPSGCDLVDFYSYGVPINATGSVACANGSHMPDATKVDWSGRYMWPYVKSLLLARGWDPASGFIVTSQTFDTIECDYARPTPANITTQTASACAAGAIATLSYINDDFVNNGHDLHGRPDWQIGYQGGNQQCQTIWGSPPPTGLNSVDSVPPRTR